MPASHARWLTRPRDGYGGARHEVALLVKDLAELDESVLGKSERNAILSFLYVFNFGCGWDLPSIDVAAKTEGLEVIGQDTGKVTELQQQVTRLQEMLKLKTLAGVGSVAMLRMAQVGDLMQESFR